MEHHNILLVLLISISAVPGSAKCPGGWRDILGECSICQSRSGNSFPDAVQACRSIGGFITEFTLSGHRIANLCGSAQTWYGVLTAGCPLTATSLSGKYSGPMIPYQIANCHGFCTEVHAISFISGPGWITIDRLFSYNNNVCSTLYPVSCSRDFVTCPKLIKPLNGSIAYNTSIVASSYYLYTRATYSCNAGFTLTGTNHFRECLHTGNWRGNEPQCSYCPELDTPANGQLTYNTSGGVGHYALYTQATYSCSAGYSLVLGNSTRSCLPPGFWNGDKPRCITCDNSADLTNGNVAYNTAPIGSVYPVSASYSCNTGYGLVGGNSSRLCLDTGTWGGTEPNCMHCVRLPTPPNGQIRYSTTAGGPAYSVRTLANYSCNTGYTLLGGNATRLCLDTGLWDGVQPWCMFCPTLEVPYHGQVTYNATPGGLAYPIYTVANYSCNTGYSLLQGNDSRMCQETGVWTGTEARCVFCRQLNVPVNGNVTYDTAAGGLAYPIATLANYSCELGYTMIGGNASRTCLENQMWDGAETTCIQCPELPVPLNTNMTYNSTITGGGFYVYTTANYTCHIGYYEEGGNFTRSCLESGHWDGMQPQCFPVQCPQATAPRWGSVYTLLTVFKSQAIYTCNDACILKGSPTRTCNHNKEWSGTEPTCEPQSLILGLGVIQGVLAFALAGLIIVNVLSRSVSSLTKKKQKPRKALRKIQVREAMTTKETLTQRNRSATFTAQPERPVKVPTTTKHGASHGEFTRSSTSIGAKLYGHVSSTLKMLWTKGKTSDRSTDEATAQDKTASTHALTDSKAPQKAFRSMRKENTLLTLSEDPASRSFMSGNYVADLTEDI